jgi:hypothetical protein
MPATTAKSKFAEALTGNRMVLTAECLPPRAAVSPDRMLSSSSTT